MQQSRYLFGYVNLHFILFFCYYFCYYYSIIIKRILCRCTGGPSSVHNYRECRSDTVLHITNDLKTLYEKFNIVVKPEKYRHDIEANCTYVNVGLLLLFLSNLGSLHGHFFIRLAARCLFGVVFLRKTKQGK